MTNDELEMADVMVVLTDDPGVNMDQALAQLQAIGMLVSQSDDQNGVIEGTVPAGTIKAIKALPFVKYVRDVFDYTADPTPQDCDTDAEDVDDAGH